MSDPNSQERPTSSKLEVRIPRATSSDEQRQQADKDYLPQDGANQQQDDTTLPISQDSQDKKGTVTNLTDETEKDVEEVSPKANSIQVTDQSSVDIQDANAMSKNSEQGIDNNQDQPPTNGTENTSTEPQKNLNQSETNNDDNVKSVEVTVSNDGSNVTDASRGPKVTDDLEQAPNQQSSLNDEKGDNISTTMNQEIAAGSKIQPIDRPKSPEGLENGRQPDKSTTLSEEKLSEAPRLTKDSDDDRVTDSISRNVTNSEAHPEKPAPPSVDNSNQETSNDSISNSTERQFPLPSSGQNNVNQANTTQPAAKEDREQEDNKDSKITSTYLHQTKDSNGVREIREQSGMDNTSERETRRSSASSSRNLEAMQTALDTRKGTGFVLSSQPDDQLGHPKVDNTTESVFARDPPEFNNEHQESSKKQPKLSTSTIKFKSTLLKDRDTTYMTEIPDNSQTSHRESGSHTYSPAYIDTAARQPPEGGIQNVGRKTKKTKRDKERERLFARLNLSEPPPKYELKLQPLKADPDPNNKAPLNPNIYYAAVPKSGGIVKTPFYVQVDIPDGALDGDVRLKFERQEFDRMKLGLTDDDTLCSCIIDLNMEPLSYCLRQNATIRMRILEKCINQFEETVIISSRHFSWTRIPTKIETRTVNGEKHFYAVIKSQVFGKFAVINTQKMDRFIIAKAGGDFHSTIDPGVKLSVEEDQLLSYPPQMVEMIVRDIKDDAVKRASKEMPCIAGSHGYLVGASPVIEISKDLIGQSGKMKHGVQFPDTISLHVPIPRATLTYSNESHRKKVVIVRKHTNPQYNTINGYRHQPNAYSKNGKHCWKDITLANRMAADSVTFQDEESIRLQITAPGKYMVLAFEDGIDSGEAATEFDLDDVSSAITETNRENEIQIMIHQKLTQPSIIIIHMVTSDAVEPISKTMESTKTWTRIYQSERLVMHEWQPIKLEFKGDLKPAVNQMTPEIRFYSKRWQGYQIQLEATAEAFATSADTLIGNILFIEDECRSVRKSRSGASLHGEDERKCVCEVKIEIEKVKAKPFKPTVVVKEVPKVPIYREYKMNWLKHLSAEDIERYKAAHGI